MKGVWLDFVLGSSFARIVMILAGYVGGEKGAGYFFQAYRLISGRNSYANRYSGLRSLIGYLSIPSVLALIVTFLYVDMLVPFIFGGARMPAAHLLRC